MGTKILTHVYNSEGSKKEINNWNIPEKEKKDVTNFIYAYETGKITKRTATNTNALIVRTLSYLKFCLEHINKEKPSSKDIENFFDNLIKDKYRGYHRKKRDYSGNAYSLKTKKSLLEALIKYYTWRFPNNKDLIEPLKIDIKFKKPEPPCLTIEQIDKLFKACETIEDKYFISVLFSSGTRAEEFHNIRYSDIEIPKGRDVYIKVRIRNEYTKTEGRTISLYYDKALESVKQYLSKRIDEGIKPEDPIFPKGYNTQTEVLNRLGKKALGRNVNYHLLRHSCASWLASKLNRQQLCIYFGWKFSSPMPDVYIKRSGVDMQEVTNKFEATEFEKLKQENEKLKNFVKEINEDMIKKMEEQMSLTEKLIKKALDKK